MKYKVIKADNRYEDIIIEGEILNKVNADLKEYNLYEEDEIIEIAGDVDGIITDLAPITEKVINSLKKCRVISKVGIGVDNIDVSSATKRGIMVCNVPNYCINEVSDHTIALILSLIRKVTFLNSKVKNCIYNIDEAKPIPAIQDQILGLVGFGSIARQVYYKAKVFGFKILIHDPFISSLGDEYDAELVDFNFLLENSDIISIHCPANKKTHHLFGTKQFDRMKPTTYLINTSRGMIIDSQALYKALKNNLISGAAVDVFDPEPIDNKNPILKLDNFIITPHIGFYSERSIKEVRRVSASNIAGVLSGEEPVNIVNPEVLS